MSEFIPHASWLRGIPEDTAVTALSIPGTHNSASIGGLFGFAQTQNLDIAAQLDAGIRFLDIRLAQCQSDLHVHHDVKCMGTSYTDILTVCRNFLDKHPSETILMSVKDESDVDSDSDKFAPSRVLQKWTRGDDANRSNGPSFEETLKAKTYEHADKAPLFYNFTPCRPLGDSVTSGHVFASGTTLGDVPVISSCYAGSKAVQTSGLTLLTGRRTRHSEVRHFRSTMCMIFIRGSKTRRSTSSSLLR